VASPSGWTVPEEHAPQVVTGIVSAFHKGRRGSESFGEYFDRLGLAGLSESVGALEGGA
jgi:sulfite reductase beta subunit-like hemoprotein